VNSHRLILLVAGAFSTAVIAFGTQLGHPGRTDPPLLFTALLATYGLGLGIGWLAVGRMNRA
jgi:hypothetical protein